MPDIIKTLPKEVSWKDMERKFGNLKLAGHVLNFKTHGFPKKAGPGNRLWILWHNQIMGWLKISHMEWKDEFLCETTGEFFRAGKYIVCSGDFHKTEDLVQMKGFQGIRYTEGFY